MVLQKRYLYSVELNCNALSKRRPVMLEIDDFGIDFWSLSEKRFCNDKVFVIMVMMTMMIIIS